MTKRTCGILTGVIGAAAVGAWWWSMQRSRTPARPFNPRGTTIFHNTPTALDMAAEGVI